MGLDQRGQLRIRALLGYGLFAVLVFAVGLFVTFPVAQLGEHLARLASSQSGMQVSVSGTTVALPNGLLLERLSITPAGQDKVVLDDVQVHVALAALRDDTLALAHVFEVYGGRVAGDLDIIGPRDDPGFEWQGKIDTLDLSALPIPDRLPGLSSAKGVTLSGSASLDGGVGWRGVEPLLGTGEVALSLTDVNLLLPGTPLGTLKLPLGAVKGRFKWANRRLTMSGFSLRGEVASLRGTGKITLGATPISTRMDLRFTGTLGESFPMVKLVRGVLRNGDKPVTISLKGSMLKPQLRINGKSLDRLLVGG